MEQFYVIPLAIQIYPLYKKEVLSIIVGAKPGNSCTCLFKSLQILPLPWEHILSLMNFTANNKKKKIKKFSST
jgi:hypothetical protein